MATLTQTPKPQGQSLEQDLQNGEPKQAFPPYALSQVFIIVTGSWPSHSVAVILLEKQEAEWQLPVLLS